jgi:hypothetical protein
MNSKAGATPPFLLAGSHTIAPGKRAALAGVG